MRTETKLTKRTVEAIPTPAKGAVAEAWDSELRGFHVRVSASGRRTFRLFYRHGGRQADPLRALVDAAGARLTAGTRKPEKEEEGANVLRLSGEAD